MIFNPVVVERITFLKIYKNLRFKNILTTSNLMQQLISYIRMSFQNLK